VLGLTTAGEEARLAERPPSRRLRMICKWVAIFTTAVVTSLSAGRAYAQTSSDQRARDRWILDSLARKHPCGAVNFPVITLPDSSKLPPRDRCTLVTTAFDYVRKGAATRAGMNPGDTADIEQSRVVALTFKNLSRGPAESYWMIDFVLRDRSYAIAVRIDRRSGRVSAGRAEK